MLIGHQRIWNFLIQSVAKERLAHAYLFVGPPQLGKKKVALEFAKLLQCETSAKELKSCFPCGKCRSCLLIERNQHPDVLLIEPGVVDDSSKETEQSSRRHEIKIEQVRLLQHQINLSPYSGKRKIVIIDLAEYMTQEAANCLLKTLEEPPQKSILILVSSAWQRFLPTIISRCQLIKFLPVKRNLVAKGIEQLGLSSKLKIDQVARYACGRQGVAVKIQREPQFLAKSIELAEELHKLLKKNLTDRFSYAKDLSQKSALVQETLDQWVIWLRDLLLGAVGKEDLAVLPGGDFKNIFSLRQISRTIKNINHSQRLLQDNSLNSRLILEHLMIKI